MENYTKYNMLNQYGGTNLVCSLNNSRIICNIDKKNYICEKEKKVINDKNKYNFYKGTIGGKFTVYNYNNELAYISYPFSLERFVVAQKNSNSTDWKPGYHIVKSELMNGKKKAHWIWYIFPMIKGDSGKGEGVSPSKDTDYFSIKDVDHAVEYLDYYYLRNNYLECIQFINDWLYGNNGKTQKTLLQIVGQTDEPKVKSSVSIFILAAHKKGDKEIYDLCKSILFKENNNKLADVAHKIISKKNNEYADFQIL